MKVYLKNIMNKIHIKSKTQHFNQFAFLLFKSILMAGYSWKQRTNIQETMYPKFIFNCHKPKNKKTYGFYTQEERTKGSF